MSSLSIRRSTRCAWRPPRWSSARSWRYAPPPSSPVNREIHEYNREDMPHLHRPLLRERDQWIHITYSIYIHVGMKYIYGSLVDNRLDGEGTPHLHRPMWTDQLVTRTRQQNKPPTRTQSEQRRNDA